MESAQAIGLSVGATFVPKSNFEFLQGVELRNACDLHVRLTWTESIYAKREDSFIKWYIAVPLLVGMVVEWSIGGGWGMGLVFLFMLAGIGAIIKDHSSTTRRLNQVSAEAYRVALVEVVRRQKVAIRQQEKNFRKVATDNLKRASRASNKASMPLPIPRGVTPRGAEELCAKWMSFLGAIHVKVTKYASDGGIDVESFGYIAQVKNYTGTVGVAAVREFSGVAKVDGRMGLFFTSGNFAAGAIEFADKADIALFRYSAERGELYAVNVRAEMKLARGLL